MAIADVDLKPTEAMARAAERGLRLREEHGRGGTEVGVARARDIKNRKNLSPGTVKRMHSYFSRHTVDKKGKGWGKDSAGYIAWLLWGGDPGESWASRKVKELEKASGKSESSRGELFCPLNVQRYDPDMQEERPIMFSRESIAKSLGVAAKPAIFAVGGSKALQRMKPIYDQVKKAGIKTSNAWLNRDSFSFEAYPDNGDGSLMISLFNEGIFCSVLDKKGNLIAQKNGNLKSAVSVIKKALAALEARNSKHGLGDACWPGYEAVGMKTKDGKRVPNCVPAKSSRKATK
jgi:hypothetical protein